MDQHCSLEELENMSSADDGLFQVRHPQSDAPCANENILQRQSHLDLDNNTEMITVTPPTSYLSYGSGNTSRPTRESVLQRLSEALLRRSLTKIDLSQRGLVPSDARLVKMALLQNAQLSSLKLGYNNLGDQGVAILAAGISQHLNLQSLDLGFNNIGDEGCRTLCEAVPKGSQLQTLYLAGNLIGEDGAMSIADLIRRGSSIRKLYLTGNLLGPEGVSAISEAILDFEQRCNFGENTTFYDSLSGDDCSEEKKMPNGTVFDTCNEVSSVYSGQLTKPYALEQLFLGGAGIRAAGCNSIAKLVRSTTRLRVLSLPNCEIGDESVAVLSSCIKANREKLPLESLQLSFNRITCRGMESLSNAVWGSRTIKELLLDNNQISDRGAQQIAAVLPHVKTIEVLNVGFNQIKAQGIKLLMKAVVDSISIKNLSVSGNAVDTSAAKAIAYALAYNTSIVSLSVVHCNIGHEGQRHISAGVVSNSKTQLRDFSGFKIGPVVVTLGFPGALEHWTNIQILNFIHLMWQQNQSLFASSTNYSPEEEEKMMDPLNFLSDTGSKRLAPLEATIVVDVAKKAFSTIVAEGYDVFSRRPEHHEAAESPLVCDGIMVESFAIQSSFQEQQLYHHQSHTYCDTFASNEVMPTNKTKSFVASPEVPKQLNPDPSRKKRIVEWLCSNIQHINKCAQTPFSSAELWKLHQHYFTPVVNECGGSVAITSNESASSSLTISSVPGVSRDRASMNPATENRVCDNQNQASTKISHNNPMSSLPMLKRKVSYRFLGDAAHGVVSSPLLQPNSGAQPQTSVSLMIEGGPSIPALPPKTKRARRNRSRISFLPRVKAKLDSYLDVCHEKALITMRQLYFVEQAILSGKVNPIDQETTPRTHLCGDLAADAETIVVDMI